MDLYLGGTEIPGWRTLLEKEGATHVSLSYMGLRRRTKFTKPWIIAEKYPADQSIFLDSGAYTINTGDDEKYAMGELRNIAADYMNFVDLNIDRIEMVSEFDALVLGKDWIDAAREDFWDDIPEGKFLPIWHAEWGLEELDYLASTYKRIGIPQTVLGGRNLTPTLNSLVNKYGTKLHGVAMTKPDEMAAIRWDSVASTSWISPSQYGDTIIWTGNELKRYPKKYKDQARRRHRTLFSSNGFDVEKIEADDSTEVLRLSIWSWQRLIESVNRHQPIGVTTLAETPDDENWETEGGAVVKLPGNTGKELATPTPRPTVLIPSMAVGFEAENYIDGEGKQQTRQIPVLRTPGETIRVCDSCFLASKCPMFTPGASCAYNMPVEIKTKSQLKALNEALIEMQTQRVFFARTAEEIEGGYPDPNLSSEVDRLNKMIKQKHEMEQEGYTLDLRIKERGQSGMISRLFGSDAGEKAQALPQKIEADQIIEAEYAELVEIPGREV